MSGGAFVIFDLDVRWHPLLVPLRERGLTVVSVQSRWRFETGGSWLEIADWELILEEGSATEIAAILRKISAACVIVGILTDQDSIVAPLAEAARTEGIPFTNPHAVALCRDKGSFRCFLESLAYKQPTYRILELPDITSTAESEIGFPCVLKPARGSGSRICYPLYDSNQCGWYSQEYTRLASVAPDHMKWLFEGGLICESWLEGPVVSVAVACTGTDVSAISCALHLKHDENPCVGFGSVSCRAPISGPLLECARYGEQLISHLRMGLGIFDIEMVLTPSGPVVLEVNPRPMGGEMVTSLAMRAVVDLYGYVIDLYCGHAPDWLGLRRGSDSGIYKIVARSGGTINSSFDINTLRGLMPTAALLCPYRLSPGATVHALEVLARVVVVGENMVEQMESIDLSMRALSTLAGIEMVTASPSIATQLSILRTQADPP